MSFPKYLPNLANPEPLFFLPFFCSLFTSHPPPSPAPPVALPKLNYKTLKSNEKRLLVKDPNKRMTAEEACAHPWVASQRPRDDGVPRSQQIDRALTADASAGSAATDSAKALDPKVIRRLQKYKVCDHSHASSGGSGKIGAGLGVVGRVSRPRLWWGRSVGLFSPCTRSYPNE